MYYINPLKNNHFKNLLCCCFGFSQLLIEQSIKLQKGIIVFIHGDKFLTHNQAENIRFKYPALRLC